MKECIIFGSADMHPDTCIKTISKGTYIIAADGGVRHVQRLKLYPDLFVGDMDSQHGNVPSLPNTLCYPPEKDDTDSFLAVKKALELGYESFTFYGCSGGSLRHTLANLQMLLYLAKRGKKAVMIDGTMEIYLLHNSEIDFEQWQRGMISVFAFSEQAIGVTLSGLKYPLKDTVLTNEFPLGVSNEFIGERSKVQVKQGDLLLVLEKSK